MIELLTLGVLDLRSADRREVRTVLRQPKRLALLAYLAATPPRRYHRRDTLLALFWPDLDQDHARAALRRSIHFLRKALGADAIAGRGDEEVAVPEDALWCDATALDHAVRTAAPDAAVALYRGTFLDGLHVEGASTDFQDWLDGERDRLRRQAAGAATSMVERAEREGHAAAAASWGRRAVALMPDDEGALRRLLALLDRAGDRAGAVQAYEEFARRVAEDLDLAPAPETWALAESIRTRGADARSSSETTIAVLPFQVRGDPRLAYLGEGMVDLLATKLDGAGAIRTVDPRAMLGFLARRELGAATTGPTAREAARHFGAGHYLQGSVVESAGRIEVLASLYRSDGTSVASGSAAAPAESALFDLVDEIARQLLATPAVAPGTRLGRIAARTSGSLEALRAYLQGERDLRGGRYFDAMERFQTAVSADRDFALAWYRLASAAAGCALPDVARGYAEEADRHRARLSPHDHLVLSAQRAWLDGSVGEAESLYHTVTGTYPDDVEAWFHMGDLLFHLNPLRGRSATEARRPFERVVALEPDHVGAMVHLARIAALEGRRDVMLDLIERVLHASPDGDQALAMRALRSYSTGDQAGIEAIAAELDSARAITVGIAFADVALYAGNLEGAEALARRFLLAARSAELRALCHIQLACLAAAGGRTAAALEELGRAERFDRAWGLEVRGLLALRPDGPATEEELRALRTELEGWDAGATSPSTFLLFSMHNDLHSAIREYLLALVSVRLGECGAAGVFARQLSARATATGSPVDCLAAEVEAAIARAEGRTGEALAILDRSRPRLWFQLTVGSPFLSLASRRFLQAELLREAGRLDEAAGWYGSIAQRSPYELVYAAPARARMAELESRRLTR